MSDPKIDTVKRLYVAFGRGDVAAILEHVAEDVDWASVPGSTVAPWHGVHRGRADVPRFFKALGGAIEVTRFEPISFASNERDVMVFLRFGFRVPATGKSCEMDLHHYWRFDGAKIVYYRGSEDSALTKRALER